MRAGLPAVGYGRDLSGVRRDEESSYGAPTLVSAPLFAMTVERGAFVGFGCPVIVSSSLIQLMSSVAAIFIEADRPQQLPPNFFKGERHDLPPSLVEDTIAHDEHPSAEPSRQGPVPRRCGPKTTRRLDLRDQDCDCFGNRWPRRKRRVRLRGNVQAIF
jgi:hypothetical protein